MTTKKLDWHKDATKRSANRAERFKSSLQAVAEAVASHDLVDAVSVRHVDEAYQILAQNGLHRSPWYKRTELEAGVGSLLLAASFSSSDVVGVFIHEPTSTRIGITLAAFLTAFIVGLLFWFHAWFRIKRIPRPSQAFSRNLWKCWPWFECIYEIHPDAPAGQIAAAPQQSPQGG